MEFQNSQVCPCGDLAKFAIIVSLRRSRDSFDASRAVDRLAEQTYPEFDTLVMEADELRGANALRRLLECTKAEMFSVLTPDIPWEPERLSSHAASLMRVPEADYAYTPGRRGAPGYGRELVVGSCTFRRASLEGALSTIRPDASPSYFQEIARTILHRQSGIAADVPQSR